LASQQIHYTTLKPPVGYAEAGRHATYISHT
jgi:hypothetical protein